MKLYFKFISILLLSWFTNPLNGSNDNILKVRPSNARTAKENVYLVSRGPAKGPIYGSIQGASALRVSLKQSENWYWVIIEQIKYDFRGFPAIDTSYTINLREICKTLGERYTSVYDVRWIEHDSFELEGNNGVILVHWLGDGNFSFESKLSRYVNEVDWFSILVPRDWKPNANGYRRLEYFNTPIDSHLTFSIELLKPYSGMTLEAVLEDWKPSLQANGFNCESTEIRMTRLNRFPAIELGNNLLSDDRELLVFVRCGEDIYKISVQICSSTERTVRDILATFKPIRAE